MKTVPVGTVGLKIKLTIERTLEDGTTQVLDPTTATTRQIRILKPNHTDKLINNADVSTNSADEPCLMYETVLGDIDVVGEYTTQGWCVMADGDVFPSETVEFEATYSIEE